MTWRALKVLSCQVLLRFIARVPISQTGDPYEVIWSFLVLGVFGLVSLLVGVFFLLAFLSFFLPLCATARAQMAELCWLHCTAGQ